MDTLLVIIAPPSAKLQEVLSREGIAYTELQGRGGFSRKKMAVFYVGVVDADKERVLELIKKSSSSQKEFISGLTDVDDGMVDSSLVSAVSTTATRVGGATVFELSIAARHKF